MLFISGILVHIVFLISIFDIYFKSPVITGVPPFVPQTPAPASRLVLFVADGLRAESLLKSRDASYLKSIMRGRGSWGISNTRVPTESRPGHVAIIAGFYEDPSAVARGWQENPVEFDSLFNRSHHTWSWGSPDILPMFAKGAARGRVDTDFYSHEEEDFSGKISTTKLDTWVFDRVETFFAKAQDDQELMQSLKSDRIVFFLHLLGLDTAGHTHKPHSKEYKENIAVVDQGVERIEKIIENFYNDNKTAYVFTADHGMTDWGSHGSGHDHETKTPIIAWGAGIASPLPKVPGEEKPPPPSANRKDIHQADICPLMATLIGVATPVNSVGVLPEAYLGASLELKAQGLYSNARQMISQYVRMREATEAKTIPQLFKPFNNLTFSDVTRKIQQLEKLLKEQNFEKAILLSKEAIALSLVGLDYYHNYYQSILLTCMTMSFLGWIWWQLTVLLQDATTAGNLEKSPFSDKKKTSLSFWKLITKNIFINAIFVSALIVTFFSIQIQDLPVQYYVYCLLPLLLWWKGALSWKLWFDFMKRYKPNNSMIFNIIEFFFTILVYLAGLVILVSTFFHRWALSIGILGLTLFPFKSPYRTQLSKPFLLSWISSCISLAGFTFLPVIGNQDDKHLVAVSGVAWFLCCLIFLSLYSLPMLKFGRETKRENVSMVVPAVMMLLAVQNKLIVAYQFEKKNGLPWLCQMLSWILAIFSVIAPLFSSRGMVSRLFCIHSCLAVFFILLSVSHEGFFLLILTINLFCWLTIEHMSSRQDKSIKLSQRSFINQSNNINVTKITPIDRALNSNDFRRAFIFLLYIIFSFFGTGNIASINSFDPQWVRCFVSQFSPFLMSALILCKTLVPFLCVACTFCAVNNVAKAPTGNLFHIVLIFSDFMGLGFLHLVTNKGSWLEIGTSISHFVIMETIVLFVSLLYKVGQFLTRTSVWTLRRPINAGKNK